MATSASSFGGKAFYIAGIAITVYGLDDLSPDTETTSVLWCLHGRLNDQNELAPVANRCIQHYNQHRLKDNTGFIAVTFDQRNHGTREIYPLANRSWKDGNENHAQDMFHIINGTVIDTSLLIDRLGSYLFTGPKPPSISQHMVLGSSLGGHAAWQVMFHDPRVTAAVIIIGCPDYMRVMTNRARLSKLPTYTSSDGADFLGSKNFPLALIDSVKKWDPKGIVFGTSPVEEMPSDDEQRRIQAILDQRITGKKILACFGGEDKLVPHHCSKPFLEFLKGVVQGRYPYCSGDFALEDIVYDGSGHTFSEDMIKRAMDFVGENVAGASKQESPRHLRV